MFYLNSIKPSNYKNITKRNMKFGPYVSDADGS